MIAWHLYNPETHGNWDEMLLSLPGNSLYQTHAWGEVKLRTGWQVLRMVALDGDAVKALAQVLVRPQPLAGAMVWFPGGPAGEPDTWADSFLPALKKELGVCWIYVRLNALGRTENAASSRVLLAGGWRRPSVRMGSGMSLSYDSARSEADRIAATSGNWRHNLKRSGKYGLTFERWHAPQVEDMLVIYRSMETLKGLTEQVTAGDLHAMLTCLGEEQFLVYRCIDAGGVTIALRACGIWGDQAIDLLAAAAPAARKQYASHGTLWALMNDCAERGVRRYDMGGADPEGNKGVFDFKRGIGAELFNYCGEWEAASPAVMGFVANLVLKFRRGGA